MKALSRFSGKNGSTNELIFFSWKLVLKRKDIQKKNIFVYVFFTSMICESLADFLESTKIGGEIVAFRILGISSSSFMM